MSDFDLVLSGTVVLPSHVISHGYVAVRDGKVTSVRFTNQPAFVYYLDAKVEVEGEQHQQCAAVKNRNREQVENCKI